MRTRPLQRQPQVRRMRPRARVVSEPLTEVAYQILDDALVRVHAVSQSESRPLQAAEAVAPEPQQFADDPGLVLPIHHLWRKRLMTAGTPAHGRWPRR